MRASRLLSILIRLQLRGRITAHAMAEECAVSVRTIYRDIDALSAAGVPVYADRGPGGGFQLMDGYRTRLTGLTPTEAETLLMVGLPGPLADLGLTEPSTLTRLKLLAAINPALGAAAGRIGDRFHLDTPDWYRRSTPPASLPQIARALWDERRAAIRYERWSGQVDRVIDPLGLVLKAGVWYLVARVGPDIRTYKVAKILDFQRLDEQFIFPAGFDLAAHWQAAVTRFEADLRQIEASLRVSSEAFPHVDRLGSAIAGAVRDAPPDASGARHATVWVESIEHAAGQLLGFADTIEVLAPVLLRDELARLARRVAALYHPAA